LIKWPVERAAIFPLWGFIATGSEVEELIFLIILQIIFACKSTRLLLTSKWQKRGKTCQNYGRSEYGLLECLKRNTSMFFEEAAETGWFVEAELKPDLFHREVGKKCQPFGFNHKLSVDILFR
jgi:hypothetical protein